MIIQYSCFTVSCSIVTFLIQNIHDEWATGMVLNDIENLTEERIGEVVNGFLRDFKEGSLEGKGWSLTCAAYIVSKEAMNACTKLLAHKKKPIFR